MNNSNEHIDDLIGKYLLGEATSAERMAVESWLQASEENKRYFGQMKRLLDKAPSAPFEQFDADKAWNKVKARIEEAPQKRGAKVISISRNKVYLRVAAAVAGVLLIGAFLLRQFSEQPGAASIAQTISTGNEMMTDTLHGGTIYHLNKNSKLVATYEPGKQMQRVQLKGEAYFEVRKKPSEEFIIETQGVTIRDIGTSFNVKSDSSTGIVEILVEEGEVLMFSKNDTGIHILAGEGGYYDVTAKTFTKSNLIDINTLAYKTRKFRFRDVPLGKVIQSLNTVYDKPISLQGPIAECNITISFDNEDINAITDLIAETLGLKKTESPQEILLEGTSCAQ